MNTQHTQFKTNHPVQSRLLALSLQRLKQQAITVRNHRTS